MTHIVLLLGHVVYDVSLLSSLVRTEDVDLVVVELLVVLVHQDDAVMEPGVAGVPIQSMHIPTL